MTDNTLDEFITAIRAGYPSVLTPAREADLLDELEDWYARVETARRVYNEGDLPKQDSPLSGQTRARAAAYEAARMDEAEAAAAQELYAAHIAYIADTVAKAYHRDEPASLDLRDCLGDSYDLFCKSLSGRRVGSAARVLGWLYTDLQATVRSYMRQHTDEAEPLDDLRPQPATPGGDHEETLLEWAENFAESRGLGEVWKVLSGR